MQRKHKEHLNNKLRANSSQKCMCDSTGTFRSGNFHGSFRRELLLLLSGVVSARNACHHCCQRHSNLPGTFRNVDGVHGSLGELLETKVGDSVARGHTGGVGSCDYKGNVA